MIYCFLKYTDDPNVLSNINGMLKTSDCQEKQQVGKSNSALLPNKSLDSKELNSNTKKSGLNYVSNSTDALTTKENLELKSLNINAEGNENFSNKAGIGSSTKVIQIRSKSKTNNNANIEDGTKPKKSENQNTLKTFSGMSQGSVIRKDTSKGSSIENTYGNKTMIFNPDCYVQILLDFIYDELKIEKTCKLDLADEIGVLVRLDLLKQYDSAKNVLQHKKTYIAVIFENDNGDYKRLTPVLKKISKPDTDFFIKLLKNANTSNKRSSQKNLKSSQSLLSARESMTRGIKSSPLNKSLFSARKKRLPSL